MLLPSLCFSCQHLTRLDENSVPTCAAFQVQIPAEILHGGDHHKPVTGDNGIQWELTDKVGGQQMLAAWETFTGKGARTASAVFTFDEDQHPRGDGGRFESTGGGADAGKSAADVASAMVQAGTEAEPQLTSLVSGVAEKNGGEINPVLPSGDHALDFKLKSEESLARKIAGEVSDSGGTLTPEQAGAKMFDINRYTTVYPEGQYASGAQATINDLRAEGNTLNVKNYWNVDSNPYQGVNVQVTTPDAQKFELQFHTDTSLAVKEGELHSVYEAQRIETNPAMRAQYAQQMGAISAKIPVPHGIGSVK